MALLMYRLPFSVPNQVFAGERIIMIMIAKIVPYKSCISFLGVSTPVIMQCKYAHALSGCNTLWRSLSIDTIVDDPLDLPQKKTIVKDGQKIAKRLQAVTLILRFAARVNHSRYKSSTINNDKLYDMHVAVYRQ